MENIWLSQKFYNILYGEAQFDGFGRFYRRHREIDQPHWTVRCRACLIFCEFYPADLSAVFGARPQKQQF